MKEWICNNHKQGHKQSWKVQRQSMESKVRTTHKVWTKVFKSPVDQGSKESHCLHFYFRYYQLPDYSVISNILKKNSSERSIAWQLFLDYSVIFSALHLKVQDGLRFLWSSASAGSQVESNMSSRLFSKRHYSQRGLHWVGGLMPPFLGLLPQS